jgi:hypothetical protein
VRLERRNLFVTLRMLAAAGIEAHVCLLGERMHLFLTNPQRGELAKLWSVILGAGATLPR